MSSGIFSKQADLAKSAPRIHGSMLNDVSTLLFLMIFSCFSSIYHGGFTLIWGLVLGSILARFVFWDQLLELSGVKR